MYNTGDRLPLKAPVTSGVTTASGPGLVIRRTLYGSVGGVRQPDATARRAAAVAAARLSSPNNLRHQLHQPRVTQTQLQVQTCISTIQADGLIALS